MSERVVVSGGDVLVGDPVRGEVSRADVLVEDGVIAAIEPNLGTVEDRKSVV